MKAIITLRELIFILLIIAMGITLAWAIPNALENKELHYKVDSLSLKYSSMKYYLDSITPIHIARDKKLEELTKQDSLKDKLYDSQIFTARNMLPADKQKLLADREAWFRKRFNIPK